MAGTLYVVAAPSGAGKTTLVKMLLQKKPYLRLSVSFTTRAPRPGEVQGREYNFVSQEEFQAMQARGDFLEWAEVHGNFYGTSRSWIEARMRENQEILLEIDWQGARQVRALFPEALGIFILPPDLETLSDRLSGRGTDSPQVIARRLAVAEAEMRHVGEFDYVIINDDLNQALQDFCAIVRASKLSLHAQRTRYPALFSRLMT